MTEKQQLLGSPARPCLVAGSSAAPVRHAGLPRGERRRRPGNPARPINLIVPWAAGGATDQVIRLTASELEKTLGQTIVIINQPGASGAIGTKSALDATRDGYTWTGGAVQDLGAYRDTWFGSDPPERLASLPHRRQLAGAQRRRQFALPDRKAPDRRRWPPAQTAFPSPPPASPRPAISAIDTARQGRERHLSPRDL